MSTTEPVIKPITNRDWTIRSRVPDSRKRGKYKPINLEIDTMCFILSGIPYDVVFNETLSRGGAGSLERMHGNLIAGAINPMSGQNRKACLRHMDIILGNNSSATYSFRELYAIPDSNTEVRHLRNLFQAFKKEVGQICASFLTIDDAARSDYGTIYIPNFLRYWGEYDLYSLYMTSVRETRVHFQDDSKEFRAAIHALKDARTSGILLNKPNDRICSVLNGSYKCQDNDGEWCNEAEDGSCSLASGQ
jgi:hypothetical protein